MKKIASLLLCAMLVFFLYACGCQMTQEDTTPTTAPTTVTTLPTTLPTTAPTTLPTTEATLPDPTLDTLLPDSELMDTGESGKDHLIDETKG